MRKFLLFMAVILAATGLRAAGYDTLFYKPNEPASLELKVDLEKYPYLEGHEVTWYAGFEETGGFIAKKILDSETAIVDGKLYLVNKDLGESWQPSLPDLRTITVFYGHKITKSYDDGKGNTYYVKDDFKSSILDTLAVCHILKPLDKSYIGKIRVNGETGSEFDIHVGDTAMINVTLKKGAEPLDIQKYGVLKVENNDTTFLAVSDSSSIVYVPEESADVQVFIWNELGIFTSGAIKTINVLPDFCVTALRADVITGKNMVSTTEEGVNEMSVEVAARDSVALVAESNAEEAKVSAVYTWNYDGMALPEGVVVKRNILEINSVGEETEGTYNCVISERGGEQLTTVSFLVKIPNATSNEKISIENTLRYSNGYLYLPENTNTIKVFSITGRLVKLINVKGLDNVPLKLNGIFIVSDGKNAIKIKGSK